MRIDRRDLQLLTTIADYRVVTIKQLVAIENRDPKTAHRRITALAEAKLLIPGNRTTRAERGRPEKHVSIAPAGYAALRGAGVFMAKVTERDVTLAGLPQVEHQLLLNWVRICWMQVSSLQPVLRGRFVSHSSPMRIAGTTNPDGDAASVPLVIRDKRGGRLTPDAVATITDGERNKTVLFFLEVDMGTEPFDSPDERRSTIVQKVRKYQDCFKTERYRDYESVWNCAFRGFRTLFVTSTKTGASLLASNLAAVRPRDFIWVTSQDDLLERGIGAPIWIRGGRTECPTVSILGSRSPDGLSADTTGAPNDTRCPGA